ncbi:hypothetical protein BDK61_2574 [Haloarcula quadrata]|uniref:Uncharacterized protein n=1 Tax=Haloarcula quadrata TaxID=182779 RepID=A0A495R819_9EURY|nr:hypothetical protein BDK61_2574 [Haloarcula quadrata]
MLEDLVQEQYKNSTRTVQEQYKNPPQNENPAIIEFYYKL